MCEEVRKPFDEGTGANIKVVVRVRPPNQRELALDGGVIISVDPDGKTVLVNAKPPFTYDVAFPTTVTQLEAFEKVTSNNRSAVLVIK